MSEKIPPKKNLSKIKNECALTMLGLYKKVQAGHIGSSLSCLDILVYLYFWRMTSEDKFILSKGHAAAALYTVLEKAGFISKDELNSYYQNGTLLAAHPPCCGKLNGITFGTGSLGHGLSLATGLALSTKFTKKKMDVYCVISDGDINEGSTWEAILFAGHHKLKNLTVIVDNNCIQAFGFSKDILDMDPLQKKFKDFNFEVVEVKNGNDFQELEKAFKKLDVKKSEKPRCIIAKTTKGSGVSYMENKMEWHYLPMDDEQYNLAISQFQ
ncbi:MAG: transketolase [Candidatus Moranbacteria bacterium]|nr:transketolase [Candidatus Moranbacteria bacterium]